MVNQYVAFWSVGITNKNKLAPLPVLAKFVKSSKDSENLSHSHVTQTTEEAALEREMCILLVTDLYELDQYGSSPEITGRWFIMDGMVRANDEAAANDAILE